MRIRFEKERREVAHIGGLDVEGLSASGFHIADAVSDSEIEMIRERRSGCVGVRVLKSMNHPSLDWRLAIAVNSPGCLAKKHCSSAPLHVHREHTD
jgi:hypothetical protein